MAHRVVETARNRRLDYRSLAERTACSEGGSRTAHTFGEFFRDDYFRLGSLIDNALLCRQATLDAERSYRLPRRIETALAAMKEWWQSEVGFGARITE
jgi:hypothetical protein